MSVISLSAFSDNVMRMFNRRLNSGGNPPLVTRKSAYIAIILEDESEERASIATSVVGTDGAVFKESEAKLKGAHEFVPRCLLIKS